MNLMKQKQRDFFDLADDLYIECINGYRNLVNIKNSLDIVEFNNKMRLVCSMMGLACEYYLKGLLFMFLRIPSDVQSIEIANIINKLSENEKYNILIGDDTILAELSHKYNIKLKELKVLQNYSIKNCGHNLESIIKKFDSDYYMNVDLETKNELFSCIKSYYFNYFGISDDELSVDASNDEIINLIKSSNISNAFVKGRYGHLDNYNLDYLKLIKLMHAIRKCAVSCTGGTSIVTGNGLNGTDDASSIQMIYPDINSKIFVINKDFAISRVYSWMNMNDFYNKTLSLAFDKEGIPIPEELEKDNQILDNSEVKYSATPEYGIEEMKKVLFRHHRTEFDNYSPSSLFDLNQKIYIDKDSQQTICLMENGETISYTLYTDNKFYKNSKDKTSFFKTIIDRYEEQISFDEVVSEFDKSK